MSITLFTTCKPFLGAFAAAQTRALASWKRVEPSAEILVLGSGVGVRECCDSLGLRHVPDVACNEFGTPLLRELFATAERSARGELLGYVNADILLASSPLDAALRVASRFARFLLVARRWNLACSPELERAAAGSAAGLEAFARARGRIEPVYGGIDLFVFSRGVFGELPRFAIGRGRWDSALLYHARRARIPVVDATDVLCALHPDHDYSHHPHGREGVFGGVEAARNEELLGGAEFALNALDATHVLHADGLARQLRLEPALVLRRLASLPALHPRLHALAPFVRALAPLWRARRSRPASVPGAR